MQPVHIAGAVASAKPPIDWDSEKNGKCLALPLRHIERDGLSFMESAWMPTPEELAMLNAGSPVILSISAPRHPVVALSVQPPPPEITGHTYIDCHAMDCSGLIVWDEIADQPVQNCRAANTIEGWADHYPRDAEGHFKRDPDTGACIAERLTGSFSIRRIWQAPAPAGLPQP